MASREPTRARHREFRRLAERSVGSFSRHGMAVYAMALSYRGSLGGGAVHANT